MCGISIPHTAVSQTRPTRAKQAKKARGTQGSMLVHPGVASVRLLPIAGVVSILQRGIIYYGVASIQESLRHSSCSYCCTIVRHVVGRTYNMRFVPFFVLVPAAAVSCTSSSSSVVRTVWRYASITALGSDRCPFFDLTQIRGVAPSPTPPTPPSYKAYTPSRISRDGITLYEYHIRP